MKKSDLPIDRTPFPQERTARSSFESSLEVVAVIGLLAGAVFVGQAWSTLPDRIPTKFSASGTPTDWGGKWTLLLFPGVSLFLYLLLSLVRRLPLRFYNIPWRITLENAARQYRLARTFLTVLKAELVWLFAFVEWMMVRAAQGASPRFEFVLFLIALGVILSTVGIYFRQSYLAR